MKKMKWKGSFTVEAALVVSVTIFVLAALIICAFFVHDRAVLQSAACEAAAAGSNFASAEDRSAAAASVKKRISAERLLGSRNLEGYAATGTKEATASWSASYPVPGFVMNYFADNQLPISVAWSCRIQDPADTIRKIRGAAELLTGGTN
jgi:hypothetical protein